jgi:diamine N-acetyltransferase
MTTVTLEPITVDNWEECAALEVKPEQGAYIPSNLRSIAAAQFYPDTDAVAIYAGEEMVGFAMYGLDVVSGKWKIFRLMIDGAHQNKGYGRAAMEQIVERLAARPDCDEILICYRPTNDVARRLYASLGFVEREVEEDKITAHLYLT